VTQHELNEVTRCNVPSARWVWTHRLDERQRRVLLTQMSETFPGWCPDLDLSDAGKTFDDLEKYLQDMLAVCYNMNEGKFCPHTFSHRMAA
jgi:hypothetical protein